MADSARSMMELLRARFGGHLVGRKAGKANQQNSWSLEWLNGDDMRRILNLILPHLILKAEQAKLVLWWLDNASGRQTKDTRFGQNACFAGMEQARAAFVEELRAMKVDPQRLSERAAERIASLMRQSDPHGDMGRMGEMAIPLAV
jgi:hypothetical protein